MRHKLSPHYYQNPCSRTNFFCRVKPISISQPFDTFPIKICSEKIFKVLSVEYVFRRSKRGLYLVRSQNINMLEFQQQNCPGWGGVHQVGKERCKMVWGNEKGKRCFLSQYLRFITEETSSRHMITVLLAHEVTTMNKHEFPQCLPRMMTLRKLQKGHFP